MQSEYRKKRFGTDYSRLIVHRIHKRRQSIEYRFELFDCSTVTGKIVKRGPASVTVETSTGEITLQRNKIRNTVRLTERFGKQDNRQSD